MRGSFTFVMISMLGLGAMGCGDAGADIAAGQHGKRLNLVEAQSEEVTVVANTVRAALVHESPEVRQYRDVAGVVLVEPISGAQILQQWLLLQDGAEFVTRTCPVNVKRGVDFGNCAPWSDKVSVSELGLGSFLPIRSLSTYLFPAADGQTSLAQVVFNMSGDERSERDCPVVGGNIDWTACSDWGASEAAGTIGVPQENAFSDEVVVSYVDERGNTQLTQELVATSGSAAWARTCGVTDPPAPCTFSSELRLSDLGIHYDAIEGIGGYTYQDGDAVVYAQTVIAADGITASRRLCPVIAQEGLQLDKCRNWEGIEIGIIASTNGAVL